MPEHWCESVLGPRRPFDQIEMLPLTALLIVITLHWPQFLSLLGLGAEPAEYALRPKHPPLPWLYVTTILSLILLFEVLPYLEELARGLRHRRSV